MAGASRYSSVPNGLELLLRAHLPTSLPLLRRLQFAKYKGVATAESRIVFVSDVGGLGDGAVRPQKFTAAYLDYSGGPETQMWLYSTLEDDGGEEAGSEEYRRQIEELIREVIQIGNEYREETTYPGSLLLGTVNTHVRRILDDMNRIRPRATGFYDKWLFKAEDLPRASSEPPEGMYWDTATPEDCEIVVSRTDIPRTPKMLSLLTSLVVRLQDGTPVSWAFLGQDGSLISLHCEEPYRRRGLAKTLAAKLMRQGPGDFADDGWCFADVAGDNAGSRGMCKSLNGAPHWEVSWVLFDVTDQGAIDKA